MNSNLANPKIKYRPDIDGLRAIAVMSVVAFHFFPSRFTSGFIGVDIFFVISGFLITTLIIKDLETGNFSFINFYGRRIKRIMPALILMLTSCICIGWFLLFPLEFRELGLHALSGALFFNNFTLLNESGYFDTISSLKPFLHLWSLGIEEQFYILWPLICFISFKSNKVFKVIVGLIIFSFSTNIYFIKEGLIDEAFYLPITRFWELLIGSMLASITYSQDNKLENNHLMSITGVILLIFGFKFIAEKSDLSYLLLLPTIGAGLLIRAGPNAVINKYLLSNKYMIFFGLISYPLYLWHWPIISYFNILDLKLNIGADRILRVMMIFTSILLAFITYKFIETPIRKRKDLKSAPWLYFIIFIIGVLGLIIYLKNGIPGRFENNINEQLSSFSWSNRGLNSQTNCQEKFENLNLDFCLIGNPEAEPTIAVIGDSHSNSLFYGLNDFYLKKNENVLNLGHAACIPFFNLKSHYREKKDYCLNAMNGALNFAVKSKSIKTIYLVSRGTTYIKNKSYNNIEDVWNNHLITNIDFKSDNLGKIYEYSMRDTFERLTATGKDIVYVIDVPELGFDPKECASIDLRRVRIGPRKTKELDCSVDKKSFEAWNEEFNKIIGEVFFEFANIKILNTPNILCDSFKCHGKKNGKILYRDDNHLSLDGSLFIGENIPF